MTWQCASFEFDLKTPDHHGHIEHDARLVLGWWRQRHVRRRHSPCGAHARAGRRHHRRRRRINPPGFGAGDLGRGVGTHRRRRRRAGEPRRVRVGRHPPCRRRQTCRGSRRRHHQRCLGFPRSCHGGGGARATPGWWSCTCWASPPPCKTTPSTTTSSPRCAITCAIAAPSLRRRASSASASASTPVPGSARRPSRPSS